MMFSDKDKKNKSIYADYSTKNVENSPIDLAPLLRKMEKRKKASRALGLVSSLIIIIGLAASGYYIYKMFQPIESSSISFDDIQDATPEEKQKSIENRNKPLTYEDYNNEISSNEGEEDKENNKQKNNKLNEKNNKNIQNGDVPSYINKLPEKNSYLFNRSIFSFNGDDNDIKSPDEELYDDNNLDNETNSSDYNSNEDGEEQKKDKKNKKNKGSSSSKDSSSKTQSGLTDNSYENDSNSKKVTLTIVGYDGNSILDTKSIKFKGTQTVASILFSACNKYGIPYKYKGSGSTVYISSLGGQAEKEHGTGSGWMVRVNGYLIDRSAGAWKVKEDDDIEWVYYSGSLEDIPRE